MKRRSDFDVFAIVREVCELSVKRMMLHGIFWVNNDEVMSGFYLLMIALRGNKKQ
jgi:hypothetical protein